MVSAQSADMVRVSFDLQQEELVYYYRAFIAMSQRAIWHDVDDDTREHLSALLGLFERMLPEPEQLFIR